ncbi:DNA-binding response regulator, LuxR family [Alloactinosynnema sp. L-07]|uniref:helix-turn-helix transcriptional regulator n=1 Tax=Alloactinosynnema sp. L-07 TaxID=1653480 RepID=UPI00065EFC0C|nr:response regulator transcription factor [Alloactinosynnema sp. L-07]CRK56502.1 DNA-binding response regulator, LuxR family [Alloactinosynnema sp. L-07]
MAPVEAPGVRVALALRSGTLRDKIDDLLGHLDWVHRCGSRDPTAGVVFVDAPTAQPGGVRVVAVLTEPAALGPAIRAGAHGVVLADDPAEDIGRAVHDVVRHGGWVSPRLAGTLLGLVPAAAPGAAVDPVDLTAREREALRLLADGLENADIAAAMFISVSAVKYHVSNILRKFDCRDRTQLVARLNRSGKTWSQD